MSIRSQDLDTNSVLLFAPGSSAKATALSHAGAPACHLPAGDEDSGEEKGRALDSDNDDVVVAGLKAIVEDAAKNMALLGDGEAAPSDDAAEAAGASATNGASAASSDFNHMVLPPGYGGAIITAFLSMIEYLNKMAEQGFELTQDSAQAMIGTNGQSGLIQSWVAAGVASAQAQGAQIMDQAIGQIVTAAVSAMTVACTIGGFAKNCTDNIGFGKLKVQTARGAINKELQAAKNYRERLDNRGDTSLIAGPASEKVVPRTPAEGEEIVAPAERAAKEAERVKRKVEEDKALTQRKRELLEGVGITKDDEQTYAAADALEGQERITAKKEADKRIDSLEGQAGRFDTKHNSWVQFLNAVNGAGGAAGQAYGGAQASGDSVESGKEKAQADALSQASQTVESVKQKAAAQQQQDIEAMGQMAQALNQALAAQVAVRG